MQSETGFPSSHQLKSYVASKSRLKLAARAVLSADAGLLVHCWMLMGASFADIDASACTSTSWFKISEEKPTSFGYLLVKYFLGVFTFL